MSDQPGSSPTFSLLRVIVLALPIALAAYAGATWYQSDVQRDATNELNVTTMSRMLGNQQTQLRMSDRYKDADGDLLADFPADAECINPDVLVFSSIAGNDDEDVWKDVVAALGEKLGKTVKFQRFSDPAEQLRALKDGELHIAVLGTGEVPTAVNGAGFIPVCVPGDAEGDFGYKMQIIVPAGSDIKKPEDIRGKRMTFTRPNSNSGYKAALVLLLDKFELAPERDYRWGFSFGHDQSIQGIVKKDLQAASVASDIVKRRVAAGDISESDFATIYESERFPPGAVGYVYNLAPELRKGIEETLQGYEFAGTALSEEFGGSGAVKFVPVNYKDDWDNVRSIDSAADKARSSLVAATK